MKQVITFLYLVCVLTFIACGSERSSGEDDNSAMEITELEETNAAIEESTEQIDSTVNDLEQALDTLEALFPELDQ